MDNRMIPERLCSGCDYFHEIHYFNSRSKYDPGHHLQNYCKNCRKGSALYFIGPQCVSFTDQIPIKIGYANDALSRISNLQVGSTHKLIIHGIIYNQNCANIERETHTYLQTRHHHGEWFSLTLQEVSGVITEIRRIIRG